MGLPLHLPICRIIVISLFIWLSAIVATAQTTAFTYQGRLTDGGNPANGNYDLQFALFDNSSGGTQIGSTLSRSSIAVSGGVFAVQLDFGVSAFPGANRFLEISARLSGAGAFTTLSPRQPITWTPYAVRSLSASSADSIPVNALPAGNGNYIQSNPPSQQFGANFNISGNGTAGGTLNGDVVNATTQLNINGNRVLSVAGTDNLFVGSSAGQANTSGVRNAFVGSGAGQLNNAGLNNSFFGYQAGSSNTGGLNNSFFGASAGTANTGDLSTGRFNSFFGVRAGGENTLGNNNSFFGANAGLTNQTGNSNTAIGAKADFLGVGNLDHATVIGADATVGCSGCIVLGDASDSRVAVGIGTSTPSERLHVLRSNDYQLRLENPATGGGFWNIGQSDNIFNSGGSKLVFVPDTTNSSAATVVFTNSGNVGIGTVSPKAKLHVNGDLVVNGLIGISNQGSGTDPLCYSVTTGGLIVILPCGSSLRYKKDVARFGGGLDIVKRLRPISFTWKDHPERDLGLAAEDVAAVEPRLVTYTGKGEIQGVKYDRLTAVLINAIKEQQKEIELQHREITQLKEQVRRLR